jgi:unsaturated rhamnogalacturonyl hydrolase
MIRRLFFAALLFGGGALFATEATPLDWSRRMADSEMKRLGDTLFFGQSPHAKWSYTSALLGVSLDELTRATGEPRYRAFGDRLTTSFVADDGTIRGGYALDDDSLDGIAPGEVLLRVYARTPEPRLKTAIDTLRRQLAGQPRTPSGGFWHKKRYPNQMWLDGLYMAEPFYAHYGALFGEPADFDDVAKQILLMDHAAYVPAAGLLRHGWDESRKQSWADPATGLSPEFWGRAVGWYAMALVNVLDHLPADHPQRAAILEVLRRVATGLARWQDPQTGVWWQVLDKGGREGNYLESSVSTMAVYALAKAVNHGWLPRATYGPVVRRGYDGILREFIRPDADDGIRITSACSVAGLGYGRDGSYAYYLREKIVDNDPKAVGPFILAGIEVENLEKPTPTGWSALPEILARIHAPTFPDRNFPITDFGAKPGNHLNTDAIRTAIEACHQAGGGHVVVPAGDWLTGPVHLLSNVDLHLSDGATLRFSTDAADYLPPVLTRWEGIECLSYSPLIYACEQENIAVSGHGTLDGQATWKTWWSWSDKKNRPIKQSPARARLQALGENGTPVAQRVMGNGSFLRPNFIQPYRCKNVLIADVNIIRSPMWEIHPVLSSNVTVRGVSISSHGPNNDGCDPESCRDVLVEGCTFDTGDDCIAIKSGRNADGRRINVPSENLVIRNCTMKDGHGGVVIGSEISGGCRNVFVENCTMDSPHLDRALRLKSNAMRGGTIENVFLRNVKIGHVGEAVLTIDLRYEEGAKGDFPPTIRNVQLDHITSTDSPRVLFVRGFAGATIEGIRITDSAFGGLSRDDVVEHAGPIEWQNVTRSPIRKSPGKR